MSSVGHPIKMLQITDTHLGADASEQLLGVNTRESFLDVLDALSGGTKWDLIVASGDIANRGKSEVYDWFLSTMAEFSPAPLLWMPGNHDNWSMMQRSAARSQRPPLVERVDLPGWTVLALNSQIVGSVAGNLDDTELLGLKESLNSADRPVIIFMHHQPVPMGSHWIDEYLIASRDQFWACVEECSHVKAVVWGHVHQALDAWRGDVRVLSTPSTCVQFLPKSREFALDRAMPGYRWFDLSANGQMTTGICRVKDKDYGLDFQSSGY